MPITQKQREQRRSHIGSSDMAAIMGHSFYSNAADVYHKKVGSLAEPEVEKTSEAAEAGNWLESSILDWAADKLGVKIRKNQRRVKGVFAANIDALVVDRPWLLECKTTGLYNPVFRGDDWGDPMTAEVPLHVLIQVHHQMYVSDTELAWVPALINGRGLQLYRVDRRQSLIDEIVRVGEDFWNNHVLMEVPPPEVPSMTTLSLMEREPETEAEVDDDLMMRYFIAKEEKKMASDRYEELKRQVIHSIGEAEAGWSNVGSVSYKASERRSVDAQKLREEYPEVAEACTKTTKVRVLRDKDNRSM